MKSTKRVLSLEVLRIVSMLMIIWIHMISYSNIYSSTSSLQPIYFTKKIINSICLVAVNCYILISGYFCIKSEFKIKKLLYIVFETFFMLIDKLRLIIFDCTFNKFINKFSIYIDRIIIKNRKRLYKKVECKNEDKC